MLRCWGERVSFSKVPASGEISLSLLPKARKLLCYPWNTQGVRDIWLLLPSFSSMKPENLSQCNWSFIEAAVVPVTNCRF